MGQNPRSLENSINNSLQLEPAIPLGLVIPNASLPVYYENYQRNIFLNSTSQDISFLFNILNYGQNAEGVQSNLQKFNEVRAERNLPPKSIDPNRLKTLGVRSKAITKKKGFTKFGKCNMNNLEEQAKRNFRDDRDKGGPDGGIGEMRPALQIPLRSGTVRGR